MKKLMLSVMVILGITIMGCQNDSTKVSHERDSVVWVNYYAPNSLNAQIAAISDSLMKYTYNSSDTAAHRMYYNEMTNLLCEKLYNNGDWWSSVPTDELLHNKKFMEMMDSTDFDGLCEIDPIKEPKLGNAISYFIGAYNYAGK